MTVLYIILGIIIGVPAYLLLNTVLMLINRLFTAVVISLCPDVFRGSAMNEIKGGDESVAADLRKSGKIIGWLVLLALLVILIIALIYRLLWLVYRVFRAWFRVIKLCWNLGSKPKTKTKTKTKNKTETKTE